MQKGDFKLHNYQDDLDTDENQTDPVISGQTDDPTRDLGIPEDEMKEELDRLDPDSDEDARESVEERDARNNE